MGLVMWTFFTIIISNPSFHEVVMLLRSFAAYKNSADCNTSCSALLGGMFIADTSKETIWKMHNSGVRYYVLSSGF